MKGTLGGFFYHLFYSVIYAFLFFADTKILSEFSKLQDKKPFIGPFLSPKNLKVKNDHRSKFSNLSNWKEEA